MSVDSRIYFLLIYAITQSIKSIRLFIIVRRLNANFRLTIQANFFSTLISIIVPLRLGELVKFLILSTKIKKKFSLVMAILIELFLDATVLLFVMILISYQSYFSNIYAISITIGVIVLLLLISSIQTIIEIIDDYVFANLSSEKIGFIIRIRNFLESKYNQFRLLYSSKLNLLLFLSGLIWLIDISSRYLYFEGATYLTILLDVFDGLLSNSGSIINLDQFALLQIIAAIISYSFLLLIHILISRGR